MTAAKTTVCENFQYQQQLKQLTRLNRRIINCIVTMLTLQITSKIWLKRMLTPIEESSTTEDVTKPLSGKIESFCFFFKSQPSGTLNDWSAYNAFIRIKKRLMLPSQLQSP